MTPSTDMRAELLERLTKATGPDRALDFAIARWQGWTEHTDEDDPVYAGRVSTWWAEPGAEWSTTTHPPHYTGSVDAALALAESIRSDNGRKIICMFHACGQLSAGDMDYDPRARPDNSVTVGWGAHIAFYTDRDLNRTDGYERYWYGDTPALAILIALIRALSPGATK